MGTKKNRSYRSGSTQHYEEKLFEPSYTRTGSALFCLDYLEKSLTFFLNYFSWSNQQGSNPVI
jgi:hypothetical protein